MAENPKKLPQINENLLDQLRGLFFAKDRSLLIGKNQMLGMGTQNTPTANPPSPYLFIYPKADGKFYRLDSTGNEQLIGATTFLELLDTPDSFTANYHLKVSSGATGLELVTGQWELIEPPTRLGGNVTDVTFPDIPQIYRNLYITSSIRTDRATEGDAVIVQINGDSGNKYDIQRIRGNDTTLTGDGVRAQTSAQMMVCEAANSRANNFSYCTLEFLDYTSSLEKWFLGNGGRFGDVSADSDMFYDSTLARYRDTNPITSITIAPATGPNFVANCIFSLYGEL